MRVYLDEDVPRFVVKRLQDKGHQVVHGRDLPVESYPDQLHYIHAVKKGADLVITCNASKSEAKEKGNFIRNVEEHLGVREKDFPVKVYPLWEQGTGNNAAVIEQRWLVHERQIEHHARQLEHTNAEKRRQEAADKVDALVRAKRERDRGKERDKDFGHER